MKSKRVILSLFLFCFFNSSLLFFFLFRFLTYLLLVDELFPSISKIHLDPFTYWLTIVNNFAIMIIISFEDRRNVPFKTKKKSFKFFLCNPLLSDKYLSTYKATY